jgi:hypothetical protein
MTSIGQQIHANGSVPGHRPQPRPDPLAGGGRRQAKTPLLPDATVAAAAAAPCGSGTYPPDLWFAGDYPDDVTGARQLVAREICRYQCPLATRGACLDAAQLRGEPIDPSHGGGVWAGLLGRDRADLPTGKRWRPGGPPLPIPEATIDEQRRMLKSEAARYLPLDALERATRQITRRAS